MADELDEFLKQAAQRRMQRQEQKQPKKPTAPRPPGAPKPPSAPSRDLSQSRPAVFEDNTPVAERSLEPSISGRHVTTQIDQADEGIDDYVRSTIGIASSLGELKNRTQNKKPGTTAKSVNQSEERPTILQRPNDIVGSSEMIRQLRDPKTLRMAILAHEILRRPYQ
ncbi:MAG: hypothetical protein LW724_07095 [Planctomycetaceae bacterium]|nr:hypothetical protein [Planctomycetaceae bacterium]